ncbi:MAG: hypothetical protein Nkreftii_003874 [Candidatus Nitrospira kreftii]|uniref:Uncharacterized protein n=1 Tax=Candidatus Nitrospira kreftii TaxID=2652173 RepID=A0A7S8FHT6_9BACT|nr:MAG: hypothetical protein Nkreftii_003874 [Candidatus Nitrospira kreftii]
MSKDLTNSAVDRQNILNNPYALAEIEKAAGLRGIPFEGKTVVLKEQVAAFFEVTLRTVENYLEQNAEELARNGYEVVTGNRLKSLKLSIQEVGDPETHFGITTKTVRLGVLDFRAFLNLSMLMTESERAGLLRKAILDIVIDTINRRTGGGTKYINQRDEDFFNPDATLERVSAQHQRLHSGVRKYQLPRGCRQHLQGIAWRMDGCWTQRQ